MTAPVGGALNPTRRGVHSLVGRRSSSSPIGPLSPEHDASADVLHVVRQLVGSAAAPGSSGGVHFLGAEQQRRRNAASRSSTAGGLPAATCARLGYTLAHQVGLDPGSGPRNRREGHFQRVESAGFSVRVISGICEALPPGQWTVCRPAPAASPQQPHALIVCTDHSNEQDRLPGRHHVHHHGLVSDPPRVASTGRSGHVQDGARP